MSHAFHTIMFQFHIQEVDEEMRAKAREGLIQPIQEISTGEDGYVIKTTVGHLSTEVRFKLGISFPSSSMDGKKIMVTNNSDFIWRQIYLYFLSFTLSIINVVDTGSICIIMVTKIPCPYQLTFVSKLS